MAEIDINCDMGESYGNYQIGNDDAIFPHITSCNVACGYHGGDALHIEKTIKNALAHGVQVGAHPGYPDLQGFGRRRMHIVPNELRALVKYQVAALKSLTESLGGHLAYVKPHGALYNTAADNEADADAIARAVREIDDDLILMGMAESFIEKAALKENLKFAAEAFADRKYEINGRLRSRTKEGAVLQSPEEAAQQVVSIVLDKTVTSYDGSPVTVQADSICIHGDNPMAIEILQEIDHQLTEKGIAKKSFTR